MNNILMSVKGNKLHLTIDLSKFTKRELTNDDLSSTGKSYTVAGSGGFKKLEGDKLEGLNFSLNLNASRKWYDERLAVKEAQATVKQAKAEIAVAEAVESIPASDLLELIELYKAMKKSK